MIYIYSPSDVQRMLHQILSTCEIKSFHVDAYGEGPKLVSMKDLVEAIKKVQETL